MSEPELDALRLQRDEAFQRKDWTEQARVQALIDFENITRWNAKIKELPKKEQP